MTTLTASRSFLVSQQFLSGWLTRDPTKRLGHGPTGEQDIRSHAWFDGLDWDKLEAKEIKPPFLPNIEDPRNVQFFDEEFTSQPAHLTPIDSRVEEAIDQARINRVTAAWQPHLCNLATATGAPLPAVCAARRTLMRRDLCD